MKLQALTQRSYFHLLCIFFQIGVDARRRNRRGNSKNILDNPAAPGHRRGPRAHGADREETALTEDATPRAGGIKGDAAEVAAMNIRDAVVLSEPLVDKRVIDIEKIYDAPILAHN